MLTDAYDPAREAAARQLAFASYRAPDIDGEVDRVLHGTDDTVRAAAVSVFADNITYAARRDRSIAVVAAAFDDPVKAVRDAAERAFYHLEEERPRKTPTAVDGRRKCRSVSYVEKWSSVREGGKSQWTATTAPPSGRDCGCCAAGGE